MHQFISRALAPAIALLLSCTITTVWANHHEHESHAAQTNSMTKGEIRRIDSGTRKLTIRHEAIPDLDMAAMTMAFRVADTVPVDKLKVGDKIRFSLGKVEGKWVVVAMETDTSP
jgi:Cu(I)/Ag(I) efflux system protein CusF